MKHIASLTAAFLFALTLVVGQPAAGQETFSGKVAETMDAGGYTYVLVDTGTNKLWAAAAKFFVKAGDAVAVSQAMPMADFHSKTLNRDFPVIYFASSVKVNGGKPAVAELSPGHPAIGAGASQELPPSHPPVAGKAASSKSDFAGFKPVKDGQTVADIYAGKAKLAGKSVTLRGKVVKYNAGIMGKNWLHIQDGTGSAGSNDLLVTSTNQATVGDTVLIEGNVAINQDFGSGYKYALLIQDAKVTVE